MTSRKRLVFSYCCLALLLAMLFAVSLFWGSVALTPQAVLAALTGRGQDALSVGIITQLRLAPRGDGPCCWALRSRQQAICCRPFLQTPLPAPL